MLNMSGLRFLSAQEFAPGRQVKKKLADFDAGAGRRARRLDLENFAAADDDLGTFGRRAISLPSSKREPADAGDARQSLTSKAHCGESGQVLGPADFAGRMPLQAEQGVVAAHSRAIINHPDEAAAARLDFDGDPRGL